MTNDQPEYSIRSAMSRRDALKLAGTGMVSLGMSQHILRAAEDSARKIPIGLQLWSVRGDSKKDFDKALEAVAQAGFDGVEFAGYFKYGNDAAALKKRLNDLGLKAAGTHTGTGSLRGDNLKKTVEFHQAIGCKFLIVPGDGAFCHPEKSKELAETFNKIAEELKPLGMQCGYHNHAKEFQSRQEDKTYWELFAERTSKDVVLQQDVGWTTHAGCDPVVYIKRYAGRTKTTHFRPITVKGDAGKKAIIGQDSVKWAEIITACYDVGGTEWFTIEQGSYPDGRPALECAADSLKGLKAILADMGR